jgi:hypothetical protein
MTNMSKKLNRGIKNTRKLKRDKPLKLEMSFDEAMKRIVRVEPAKKK